MLENNEFNDLEKQLGALKPASHLMDAQAIVFEAGRQSVLSQSKSVMNQRSRHTRGGLAGLFAGMILGVAASMLALASCGLLNLSGSDPEEFVTSEDNPVNAVAASRGSEFEREFERSESELLRSLDQPGAVLSATGARQKKSADAGTEAEIPEPPNPVVANVDFNTDGAQTYKQLLSDLQNETW